jgi:predicted nucleic acid-binding protein
MLKRYYNLIMIPRAVRDEFSSEFVLPQGIRVWTLNTGQDLAAKAIGLGKGENEAMILARDFLFPLIIDDTQAYHVAKRIGLEVYSSLGFLRGAYRLCGIDRVEYDPLIDNYQSSGRASPFFAAWAREATKSIV